MGVNAMEITVCVQKAVIITMKTCYRSACEHPFVAGMLFFSLFLYRFLPSLFFLLVSSSPVIICTAVLLGTLLSFGNPYIPEIEEEEDEKTRKTHHEISSLKSGVVANELVVEKDESFSVENFVDKSRDVKEKDLFFSEKAHEDDSSTSTSESGDDVQELEKEVHGEKRVIDDFDAGNPLIEGEYNDVVQYSNLVEKENEGEGVENFGSVQYSSISKGTEDNEESSDYDSDSDRAESSSPDASLAEIMPMLDELHPLLDSESSQPALVAVDEDITSESSHGSSDGSEEDVENAGIGDDEDDEEEEKQGGQHDGTEAVVTWTKEDEENLMDLGNSELERNRRLESLIARRRARKNVRMMMTERNLIDLDGADLPFQISPISTARRNPFDLHYDSNVGMDLPPIPGSAPSVLAPRRNPFDIPYDPLEERPNLAGGSFEEEIFTSFEKDMHFRRYESFSVGSSYRGEGKQEKPSSKLRPFFVPEHSEGIGYPTFQRQMSELSESKMSSVTEVESISSDSDQDNHKNITEQELSQSISHVEEELSQPMPHVELSPDHQKPESSSSEEGNLVDIDQEYHSDAVADEENVQERESTSLEMEPIASPMGSDTTDVHVTPDIVEKKHMELSSSSSSEANELLSHAHTSEGFENSERKENDTTASSSLQLSIEGSNLMNGVGEEDDSQTKEPVYDWNWAPSEAEKTLSGITIIEEALSYVDKRVLTSTSSVVSDTPVELPEVPSIPVQVERTIPSTDEATTSGGEGLGAVYSHLHAVEENEMRSKEVSMINEHDVIRPGISGDIQNDIDLTYPMVLSATEQVVYDSGLSSPRTEIEDENSMSNEAKLQLEQNQVHVPSSSLHPVHVDVPQSNVDVASSNSSGVSYEDSTHNVLEMPPTLSEKSLSHSSSGSDHDNSQESPIPLAVSIDKSNAIEDCCEVVHGDGGMDSSNVSALASSPALISSENEPATGDIHFEDHHHDEIQNNGYSEDVEHSNISQVATGVDATGKEFNIVEGITEIDEELLTELDAVGDFGVEHVETSTNPKENLLAAEEQESLTGLHAHEADSPKYVKDHSDRSQDSTEACTDMQGLETRTVEEVHLTPKKLLVNETEDQLQTTESNDGSREISPSLLESAMEVKTDSEELMTESGEEKPFKAEETCETSSSSNADASKSKTEVRAVGNISIEAPETNINQTEDVSVVEGQESLMGLQVTEDNSSKDFEDISCRTQDSMEALADFEDIDARSEEELHLTQEQLSINEMESEGGLRENSFESSADVKPDSEEFTAEETESIQQFNFEAKDAYEASSSSITNESEKKTGPDVVDDFSIKDLETTEIEDVVSQASVMGHQVLEDTSSKNVENASHETEDSMEVPVDLQGLKSKSEGEVHATPKELSVDTVEDQLKPTEFVEGPNEIAAEVKESYIEAKSNPEEILSEETKRNVTDSNIDVEEPHEASSSSTTVSEKKKKGSGKSSSSSSSSSSDSD